MAGNAFVVDPGCRDNSNYAAVRGTTPSERVHEKHYRAISTTTRRRKKAIGSVLADRFGP